ncbi:MAG: hypothetical protein Q9208_003528 [Pyrenodesmia sp. 3 TL-2023]
MATTFIPNLLPRKNPVSPSEAHERLLPATHPGDGFGFGCEKKNNDDSNSTEYSSSVNDRQNDARSKEEQGPSGEESNKPKGEEGSINNNTATTPESPTIPTAYVKAEEDGDLEAQNLLPEPLTTSSTQPTHPPPPQPPLHTPRRHQHYYSNRRRTSFHPKNPLCHLPGTLGGGIHGRLQRSGMRPGIFGFPGYFRHRADRVVRRQLFAGARVPGRGGGRLVWVLAGGDGVQV